MRRGVDRLLLATLPFGIAACEERGPGKPALPRELTSYTAEADDSSDSCSDLGGAHVCYAEHCPLGVCVTRRPTKRPGEALTHRCHGVGKERRCRARSELASPFVCHRGRCKQRRPRLPDDGEWECSDVGGAVLCRGGAVPAGVLRPQGVWGYTCSPRPGHPGERLCLDVDPDVPAELGGEARCHFELAAGTPVRVCLAARAKHLGDSCDKDVDCPVGARCIGTVCVPPALEPACWSDGDCGLERCNLASCGKGAG